MANEINVMKAFVPKRQYSHCRTSLNPSCGVLSVDISISWSQQGNLLTIKTFLSVDCLENDQNYF